MSDPFDRIMGDMSSGQASRSTSSSRIPKRDHRHSPEKDAPSSKRSNPGFTTPSSTTRIGRDSFAVMDTLDVQMNMFVLNLSKMPQKIQRIHVDTLMLCSNGKEINLNLGVVAVGGDVNSHNRRLAQHHIMRKFHEKKRHLFSNQSYHVMAYDSAAALYVPAGVYTGSDEEEASFSKEDFSSEDWALVSKVSRRKDDKFLVRLKPAGFVETQGVDALEASNRMELTRCVEIVTSQKLNNNEFYQFGNATFPLRDSPNSEPDGTSEIRSGFAKVARLVEGRKGTNEMLMTIDTKLSPFYKNTSVLKFVINKYAEFRGVGGGGYGGGGRGGYGGGGRGGYGGGRNDSRDSRGSYGGRSDSRDSRGGYGRSESRDSYGGRDESRGRRDSYDSRRSGGDSSGPDYNAQEVAEVEKAVRDNKNLVKTFEQALKGLFVEATHLSGSSKIIRVAGVSEASAESSYFTQKDDKGEISVAEYFYKEHNIKLKFPHMPMIIMKRFKHECFFPMEVLRILPGQRIKVHKMSATVQSAMTGRNASMPQQHVDIVQKILSHSLKLEKNLYMDAFGIELESTKPVQLKAKLLPPAQIKFKNAVYMPDMGRPAFRNPGSFIEPAHIHRVAIVSFDRAIDMRQAEDFCDRLYDYCRDNGIKVDKDSKDWSIREMNSGDNVAIKEAMEDWMKKGVSIFVGIARDKKPDVHDVLKYYEESVGMQTIQLCKQTVDKMMNPQGGRQTIENVMRKFNLKCGGTNFHVEVPNSIRGKCVCANTETMNKKLLEQVQFIGFEISHGAARTLYDRSRNQMDGEPSIVGVSYSLTNSTQLGGFSYMQTQREYKLQKLDEVFPNCVRAYKEHAKKLPSRIVIYRVGAGEGDFKRIKEEIEEIRSTFAKIDHGYSPQLVVLVAQRASHARVFPSRIQGHKAFEQNVPSGTCIDNVVTSFGYEEFILSSQTPLIGTVRPCKYTILANDPNWSKNELIHLTYFRAFGHQVSYQPPSVPDVLYAAENLAKRGKNNYKVHQRYVSLQAIERRVIAEHPDFVNEEMREQLASAIVDEMSVAMNGMTIAKRNFWA
ncbi:hypothetical protein GCK72_012027 [Caenorhabditis remanei]|uniref:Piwi domain-containing protein n=1 Tax=Caenorhabditis remanei TaxID=31234 RepID=A0A6A5GJT2_CAERE|nr:hypothetical protein GCK72_012027 [Caenorhabditis remanei]KAF1755577.1 hypothetical protein GCK72_012027 [Caenorhabditis remanei]